MNAPVTSLIAFTVWTLLVLMLTVASRRIGLILAGKARMSDFPADEPHGTEAYRRAMRAHANCVENLPVFAALVLGAEVLGYSSSAFSTMALLVVPARVLQTLTHLASGSNRMVAVRFVFFAVQIVCFFGMAVLLIPAAMGAG